MSGIDLLGACLILSVSIAVAIYKLRLHNQEAAKAKPDD